MLLTLPMSPQGGDSWDLMQAASSAVADYLKANYPKDKVLVLCGPGNNGADGLVVAAKLREAGWPVEVRAWPAAIDPSESRPYSDRDKAIKAWGEAVALATPSLPNATHIIDGLFGAGLNKDLEGEVAALVAAINASAAQVVSIDMPSGIDGRTGAISGVAVKADATVTFFRAKAGHYLQPGRALTGHLEIADIGLTPANVATPDQVAAINDPDCWRADLPSRDQAAHKYQRGRLWVLGGPWMTGAAALAAGAGLGAGAGLVGIAAPPSAVPSLRTRERALLIAEIDSPHAWRTCLSKFRPDTLVMGPGLADLPLQVDYLNAGLAAVQSVVIDADALNAFAGRADELFKQLPERAVLTPHEGEFARLFPDLNGSRVDRALAAAKQANAIMVLKGPDTVIAAPDGRILINANATAALATAGTGDVLAGIIGAFLARGASAFVAAAAGVFHHAEAGKRADTGQTGVIADDLLPNISAV